MSKVRSLNLGNSFLNFVSVGKKMTKMQSKISYK